VSKEVPEPACYVLKTFGIHRENKKLKRKEERNYFFASKVFPN